MANNCQVPTPKEYAMAMLDYANYRKNLYGKKVLENSCGEGNILCEIVQRYIEDAIECGYDKKHIAIGLENDVFAYETDEKKIDLCLVRLNNVLEKYQIKKVKWNVINDDYLKVKKKKFDFIIGNPPYITYHDMSIKQRKDLKQNYISCHKGRFDYCYAFIEKSLEELNDNAILVYLVPYSILRNVYAEELRKKILPILSVLYDYEGIKIFPDIISSSVILVCEKGKENKNFIYHKIAINEKSTVLKDVLGTKWFFDDEKGTRRFGDYFNVNNSVATLLNKAFIIEEYSQNKDFVVVGKDKIENSIVYPAVSAKSKQKDNKPLIIVPYILSNSGYGNYSEEIFALKYPETYKYLKKFKKALLKRKADKAAKWFEYGRTQALSHLLGDKLVMSMVVTQAVKVYKCKYNEIPYAGYFIMPKVTSCMNIDDAKRILESDSFLSYVKAHGTPTTPTSYRISVKEILNYKF